jgi:hypothetical protein
MKKEVILGILVLFSVRSVWSGTLESAVLETNTVVTVPAGEIFELMSAEAAYYDTGTGKYSNGPEISINVGGRSFIYSTGPTSLLSSVQNGVSTVYTYTFNNSIGNAASAASFQANTWVFSGDGGVLPVSGPATITHRVNQGNSNPILLTYRRSVATSANSVSATSVVIPQSASGDVDIKLEQSADNVTWTECLPGTYNSSTVKRFFRLRAVEK